MIERGWRVVVAVPADGPLVARLQERGAEVRFVSFPVLRRANTSVAGFARMAAEAALGLPRLLRVIKRVSPAVVYVNTVTLPWWLLAARLAGRPAICHLHEAETGDNSPGAQGAAVAPAAGAGGDRDQHDRPSTPWSLWFPVFATGLS